MAVRWEQLATEAAAVVGKTFVVGVRSHNGTWFANCDGVEFDGSGPATATRAVIRGLLARAGHQHAEAGVTARAAERAMEALLKLDGKDNR